MALQQKLGGLLATVGLSLITACGSSSSDDQTAAAEQDSAYIKALEEFVDFDDHSYTTLRNDIVNPDGRKYIFAAVTGLAGNKTLKLHRIIQPDSWLLDDRKALFAKWSGGANSLVVKKTVVDKYLDGAYTYNLHRSYMFYYDHDKGPMVNGRPAGTEHILRMAEILLEKDPQAFPLDEYTRIVKIYPYNEILETYECFNNEEGICEYTYYDEFLLVKPNPILDSPTGPQPNLEVDLAEVELVDYSYASFLINLPYPILKLEARLGSAGMAKKLEDIALRFVVPAELRPNGRFISPLGQAVDCTLEDYKDYCGFLYLFDFLDYIQLPEGDNPTPAEYEQVIMQLKDSPEYQAMIREYCQSDQHQSKRSAPNLSLYWFCSQVGAFLAALPELAIKFPEQF